MPSTFYPFDLLKLTTGKVLVFLRSWANSGKFLNLLIHTFGQFHKLLETSTNWSNFQISSLFQGSSTTFWENSTEFLDSFIRFWTFPIIFNQIGAVFPGKPWKNVTDWGAPFCKYTPYEHYITTRAPSSSSLITWGHRPAVNFKGHRGDLTTAPTSRRSARWLLTGVCTCVWVHLCERACVLFPLSATGGESEFLLPTKPWVSDWVSEEKR